jgi:thioredoxin 2
MEQPDVEIVQCPHCGAKNRVPLQKLGMKAKCGKCGSPLGETVNKEAAPPYLMRCTECGAKNKVPADKIDKGPVCGKCKSPLKTQELFAPQPLMVTEANFQEKVIHSPIPVLLFAWAPWCTTCRTFMPIVDDFAREVKGRIRVVKMNVDQTPNLSSKYAIMSVPQMFVFEGGELRENFPGALQKHEIRMKMTRYL